MFNNLNKKQKQVVNTLLQWGIDDFMPSNISILINTNLEDKQELIDSGILQIRSCQGFAYEFTKKAKSHILENNIARI